MKEQGENMSVSNCSPEERVQRLIKTIAKDFDAVRQNIDPAIKDDFEELQVVVDKLLGLSTTDNMVIDNLSIIMNMLSEVRIINSRMRDKLPSQTDMLCKIFLHALKVNDLLTKRFDSDSHDTTYDLNSFAYNFVQAVSKTVGLPPSGLHIITKAQVLEYLKRSKLQ